MADVRELLKAGAHFGHQKQKWNPKMKPYIFTERNGIHIIDLQQTAELIEEAKKMIKKIAANGETLFLVGTKRQAQDVIKEQAEKAEIPYVNYRWLGGMLTNLQTIKKSVKKLDEYTQILEGKKKHSFTKKELVLMGKKKIKLEKNLSGIVKMEKTPGAIFVVDTRKEHLAIKEARKLNIPIIGIVDTNANPDDADFPIPSNDDGLRAVAVITEDLVSAYMEGHDLYKQRKATEQKDNVAQKRGSGRETRNVAGRKVKVKRVATSENQPEKTVEKKETEAKTEETK